MITRCFRDIVKTIIRTAGDIWKETDTTDRFLFAILGLLGSILVALKIGGWLPVSWWLSLLPLGLEAFVVGLLVVFRICWDRLCRFVGDD